MQIIVTVENHIYEPPEISRENLMVHNRVSNSQQICYKLIFDNSALPEICYLDRNTTPLAVNPIGDEGQASWH